MPIMKPAKMAVTTYLRYLFTRTERALIDEILRKREQGYVDYAETAALKRIQDDLQHMVDESWVYVPQMIERRFYGHPGASEGYANAAHIAGSTNMAMMETLVDNLLGEITEAAGKALTTARTLYTIARMDDDMLRKAALSSTAYAEALGRGAYYSSKLIEAAIRNHGVTAFVDKAGRNWSLSDYCNMAARTTARQAEVAGVLTKDEHDLYQIVKIGSTCPVCVVYEGRVYSKSGTDPHYPPLAMAFGKIDPGGPDDLSNTYLNIHPNCLHSLIPFTEAGKSEKELEKLREFSSFETNPATNDPRSKAQIEAYREKERNRARLLREQRKKEIAKAEKAEKAEPAKAKPEKQVPPVQEAKYNDKEVDQALEWYVSGDGMWVNKALRNPEDFDLTQQEKRDIDIIKYATEKQAVTESALYRSVDAEAVFGKMSALQYEHLFDSLAYNDKWDDAEKLIKSAEGKDIIEKGFMSTTKSQQVAVGWGNYTGSEKPVILAFKVEPNVRGVDLARFDVPDDPQREVLLAQRARYTVNSIEAARDEEFGRYIRINAVLHPQSGL